MTQHRSRLVSDVARLWAEKVNKKHAYTKRSELSALPVQYTLKLNRNHDSEPFVPR